LIRMAISVLDARSGLQMSQATLVGRHPAAPDIATRCCGSTTPT